MADPRCLPAALAARFDVIDEGVGARGQGSFGKVFMAVDKTTDQLVAVKRARTPSDPAARELCFLRF